MADSILKKLPRYRKFILFFLKYWRSDLFDHSRLESTLGLEYKEEVESYDIEPAELAADLKQMGVTFIKLGQLLSTRPDLLPIAYTDALSHLQDDLEPIAPEEIENIIPSELGARMSKLFAEFDRKPMASASIGQVHRATLRSGQKVAVKVQRPNIRNQIVKDLDALDDIISFLVSQTAAGKKFALDEIFRYLRKILLDELDYLKEARNLQVLKNNLQDYDLIIVPAAIDDYTTSKVLTMEYFDGIKVVDVTPLRRMELDGEKILNQLFEAYLDQIVTHGFLHADPHPGNVHLLPDDRLVLLDLGMVARLSPRMQEQLLKLLLSVSGSRTADTCQIMIEMSQMPEGADLDGFSTTVESLVLDQKDSRIQEMKTGQLVIQLNQAAANHGLHLPVELNLVAKVLLNLDQIGVVLSPEFKPNTAIQKYGAKLMDKHMWSSLTTNQMFSTILDTKKLAEELPHRINRITDRLAKNEFELKIEAFDEKKMMAGMQKIANRITLGLILASLVIGAALLMRIKTTFQILGYPGLAMIFFLCAAIGVILLSYQIVFKDDSAQ